MAVTPEHARHLPHIPLPDIRGGLRWAKDHWKSITLASAAMLGAGSLLIAHDRGEQNTPVAPNSKSSDTFNPPKSGFIVDDQLYEAPTPTSTSTSTATETGIPTGTPTPKPLEIATPTATQPATAVPKEFPIKIEVGQFGEYTKGVSLEEAKKFIEIEKNKDEDSLGKPFLNLRITDPKSILWATGNVTGGTIFAMENAKPVSAFSPDNNCKVISDTEFGILLNQRGLIEPIIVVTTPEELAEMGPKLSPTFKVVIPGKGDVIFREIILTPHRDSLTEIKWLKQPGEIVQQGEDFFTIEKGHFVYKYVDHLINGTRVLRGNLTDFIQLGDKPLFLNPK